MKKFSILVAAIAVSSCHAFVIGSTPKTAVASSTTAMNMGLINDLKTLFSEEGRANRAAYAEQQRKEMEEAQREILERRTDPEAMGKYEEEIIKRRSKFKLSRGAASLWRTRVLLSFKQKWKCKKSLLNKSHAGYNGTTCTNITFSLNMHFNCCLSVIGSITPVSHTQDTI